MTTTTIIPPPPAHRIDQDELWRNRCKEIEIEIPFWHGEGCSRVFPFTRKEYREGKKIDKRKKKRACSSSSRRTNEEEDHRNNVSTNIRLKNERERERDKQNTDDTPESASGDTFHESVLWRAVSRYEILAQIFFFFLKPTRWDSPKKQKYTEVKRGE